MDCLHMSRGVWGFCVCSSKAATKIIKTSRQIAKGKKKINENKVKIKMKKATAQRKRGVNSLTSR